MFNWFWNYIARKIYELPRMRDEQLYRAVQRLENFNKNYVLDMGYHQLIKDGELNGVKYWLKNQEDLNKRMIELGARVSQNAAMFRGLIADLREECNSGKDTTGRAKAKRPKGASARRSAKSA